MFATLLARTLEAGKENAAQNIIAGFRACGIFPLEREVVLAKLKDYSKPMEEIRESVGDNFIKYISEIRDSDLQIQQNRKFQIPVVAGTSVSLEQVEEYYKEREKSKVNKKNKNQKGLNPESIAIKKRGAPLRIQE